MALCHLSGHATRIEIEPPRPTAREALTDQPEGWPSFHLSRPTTDAEHVEADAAMARGGWRDGGLTQRGGRERLSPT